MPNHPRLARVGHRFHLRAKVPLELRAVIGKREVWRSLRTSDSTIAIERIRVESVRVDQQFAEARRKLRAERPRLTDDNARRMVLLWFHRAEQERADQSPLAADVACDLMAELDQHEAALTSPDERAWAITVKATTDAILLANGWTARTPKNGGIQRRVPVADVDEATPEYWRLTQLARRALLEQVRRDRSRLRGQPVGETFDPLFVEAGAGRPEPDVRSPATVTLERLVDLYINDPGKSRSGKTRAGYVVVFRALKELLRPDKPVRDITREDCRRVRDVIMRLPPNATKRFPGLGLQEAATLAQEKGLATITAKSVNSYLTNLASLFNWAVAEGYQEQNPATRLTVAVPKRAKKTAWKPFSKTQLRAIFDAPLYRGCANDRGRYATPGPNVIRRGRFWVPLVGLFSGMRLNEICQLRVTDVIERDGVPMILVRQAHDDQRVKSEAGERTIPVHAELIRCGFVDHVKAMRDAGEERLFPELPRGNTGYYSDPFAKWFARFLDNAGPGPRRPPSTRFGTASGTPSERAT